MDKMTMVVLAILIIVLAIFIGTQIGDGSSSGEVIRSAGSYASQYGGGGCGR